MKNNRLPLYLVFVLVALAIVYRITNPPAPAVPGPLGGMPTWRSEVALGKMIGQAVNPSGTRWAGVWSEPDKAGKSRSAAWVIDFNAYSAKSCVSPENVAAESLTWADDNTIRLVCASVSAKDKGPGIVLIDAVSAKVKSPAYFVPEARRILYWPGGSDVFVGEAAGGPEGKTALAAFTGQDNKASMVGKQVDFEMPKDGEFYTQGGVATDGSSFVFSVADPAASDGRSFYLADTKTGAARKMFDLGDEALPGGIEGMWPSAAGVLIVCRDSKNEEHLGELRTMVFDPAAGKLVERKGGVSDLGKWPGAPKAIGYTTVNGGFSFDLATGKNKTLFDLKKKTSYADKRLRDAISMCRLYKIKSGDLVAVSESSGAIDIRELKPDGSLYRNVLPRE
jgi:hypothetical protein